jgi:hypothetical protein
MKQFREKKLGGFLWSNDFYLYKGILMKKFTQVPRILKEIKTILPISYYRFQ